MLVSIEQARNHLRSHGLGDDDDLSLKIAAVEDLAQEYTDRKIYPTQQDMDIAIATGTAGDHPMVVNAAIQLALLMMVASAYENRSDVTSGTVQELPNGSRHFLAPYRKGMGV